MMDYMVHRSGVAQRKRPLPGAQGPAVPGATMAVPWNRYEARLKLTKDRAMVGALQRRHLVGS